MVHDDVHPALPLARPNMCPHVSDRPLDHTRILSTTVIRLLLVVIGLPAWTLLTLHQTIEWSDTVIETTAINVCHVVRLTFKTAWWSTVALSNVVVCSTPHIISGLIYAITITPPVLELCICAGIVILYVTLEVTDAFFWAVRAFELDILMRLVGRLAWRVLWRVASIAFVIFRDILDGLALVTVRLAYFHVVALAFSLHWLVFAAVHSATILASGGFQAPGTFIHGFFKIALIKVENIGVSYMDNGKTVISSFTVHRVAVRRYQSESSTITANAWCARLW